ncbi:MAG: cobalamin-dependent protein [Pseudomonadota bacterium]
MNGRAIRVILGKVGLDGHDNGVRIVAKWLADEGMEVTYLGLHNTPEGLINAAIQEDADLIGCSFLGGEHLYFTPKLLRLMKDKGATDLKLVVGGVIPPDDVIALERHGVDGIFTPGTRKSTIVNKVIELCKSGS